MENLSTLRTGMAKQYTPPSISKTDFILPYQSALNPNLIQHSV